MNIINIIILIILVLFITGISLFIYFSTKKKSGGATGTAPPASYCQQYPNAPQCQNIIQCGILSAQTIKKCGPGIDTNCSDCQCGENTDPNNRIVCMSCQETDGTFRISVDKNDCTDPFVWNDDLQACFLGTGSYCLPNDTNPNIPCSPYTGFKLLTQSDPKSPYEWKCVCKDDTKFTNDPNTGDCIGIAVCNMEGKTNPNVYTSTERALIKANVPSNQSPILWDGTNFDPLKQGMCQCNEDEYFDKNSFSCLPDPCLPGSRIDSKTCSCPVGYLDCNTISYSGNIDLGVCSSPSCIPDPCFQGNPNNYYQPGHGCVCDATSDDPSQRWYPFQSPKMTLPTCAQLCSKSENPCIDGETGNPKGTCFVPSGDNKNTIWKFELAQSGAPRPFWMAKIDGVTGTNSDLYYLNVDSNNKLNIQLGKGGVPLQIFDVGATGAGFLKNVPQVLGGQQYIMNIYNPTTDKIGNSLNFLNLTFDQSVVVNTKNYTFTFNSPPKLSSNSGYILIDSTNGTYLNSNNDNSMVERSIPDFNGVARCKCCVQPFSQDSDYLCNNRCIMDGQPAQTRTDDLMNCQCCSGIWNNDQNQCLPNPNYQSCFDSDLGKVVSCVPNLQPGQPGYDCNKCHKLSAIQFGCNNTFGTPILPDYSSSGGLYSCK